MWETPGNSLGRKDGVLQVWSELRLHFRATPPQQLLLLRTDPMSNGAAEGSGNPRSQGLVSCLTWELWSWQGVPGTVVVLMVMTYLGHGLLFKTIL